MAQKIKTLKEADRDTRAAIARTKQAITELQKSLPKLQGQERADAEAAIKQYAFAVKKMTQSLGR